MNRGSAKSCTITRKHLKVRKTMGKYNHIIICVCVSITLQPQIIGNFIFLPLNNCYNQIVQS